MRVAIWHNLPSGGGKRALHDQVQGLLARGHTVEVWCPPTADRGYLPLGNLILEHVVPLRSPRRSRFGRLGAYNEVASRLRAMGRHCQLCAQEINVGRFDLLLAHPSIFFHSVSIARSIDIPTVLYLQEPSRGLYEAMPDLVWMAPPPLRTYGRLNYRTYQLLLFDAVETRARRLQVREEVYAARAFDRILVNSLYSRESVLRIYGVDARVCYLGIDDRLFVDRGQPREPIVVGVGALIPSKNVHAVIDALSRISNPPRLVWVGNVANEGYVQSLHARAAQAGVGFEPHVRTTDAELVDLLNRAAVMVYTPRLEPFGYAPLEANACGVPVVAVAEGGVRETVFDGVNGLIVDADANAVAAAVQRLLADRPFARALAAAGRRLIKERWSLEQAACRLECHLTDVVNASHRT
jgi:glycosyltransferase involved in cell wall biosynthesis